jgi:hypothetical protein
VKLEQPVPTFAFQSNLGPFFWISIGMLPAAVPLPFGPRYEDQVDPQVMMVRLKNKLINFTWELYCKIKKLPNLGVECSCVFHTSQRGE